MVAFYYRFRLEYQLLANINQNLAVGERRAPAVNESSRGALVMPTIITIGCGDDDGDATTADEVRDARPATTCWRRPLPRAPHRRRRSRVVELALGGAANA